MTRPQRATRIPLLAATVLTLLIGGAVEAQVGGVLIDPEGAIQIVPARSRAATRPVAADRVVRTVSLRRLLETLAARDGDPTFTESRLAGLTRVDAVEITADDVRLVGEAIDPDTLQKQLEAVARESKLDAAAAVDASLFAARPVPSTLWLEDLAYALEHVAAGRGPIGCSIDETPDGMRRLQQAIRANSRPTSAASAAARYPAWANVLGDQDVTIFGLPEDSHAAIVTVVADVRLKRIALGVDASGVRPVKSQLDLLRPQGNSVQRWWFTPQYDPIAVGVTEDGVTEDGVTEDGVTRYELSGPRLKVLAQEEVVGADGRSDDAAGTRRSTQAFAKLFTANMDAVAARHPAVDALQDLSDAFMVAGLLLRHERDRPDGSQPLGWDVLAAVRAANISRTTWTVPKTIATQANAKRAGRSVVGLLGGVKMTPHAMPGEAGFADAATKEGNSRLDGTDGWFSE